jgi:hypothetical protein
MYFQERYLRNLQVQSAAATPAVLMEPDCSEPTKKRHRAGTWSEDQREAKGFTAITQFFSPPPKPGRPAGLPPKKRGRPVSSGAQAQHTTPAATASAPATPAIEVALAPPPKRARSAAEGASIDAQAAAAAAAPKAKATRVNWSVGEPLERLTKAVADYDNKTGTWNDEEGMSLRRFAKLVGIPIGTLSKYICEDKGKRLPLGSCVGPNMPQQLDKDSQQFVVDVMRRARTAPTTACHDGRASTWCRT